MIILRRERGENGTHTYIVARRGKVLAALRWLKENNPLCNNIEIDYDTLAVLPEGGEMPGLITAIGSYDPEAGAGAGEWTLDPRRAERLGATNPRSHF